MDLRKSVLLTKVQKTSSNLSEKSLNNSILSAYDTADESGDNSLYFSFNESQKSADCNISNASSVTSTADMDDKENLTVIENCLELEQAIVMKERTSESAKLSVQVSTTAVVNENQPIAAVPESMEVDEKKVGELKLDRRFTFDIEEVRVLNIVKPQSPESIFEPESAGTNSHGEELIEADPVISIEDESMIVMAESFAEPEATTQQQQQDDSVQLVDVTQPTQVDQTDETGEATEPKNDDPNQIITIEDSLIIADPNENLVNPFIVIPDSPVPAVRKTAKRSSIISTQAHYYSPVIRRSTDQINFIKPVAARRTVFSVKPSELKAPVPRPRTVSTSENPPQQASTSSKAALNIKKNNPMKIVKESQKPKIVPATTQTASVKPPTKLRRSVIPTAIVTKPPTTATTTKTIPAKRAVTAKPTQSKPDQVTKTSLEPNKGVKRKSSPRKPPSSQTASNTAGTSSTRSSSESAVPAKVPKLSQFATQPCKYCGKKFKESAFVNHWADNCTVIPLQEKKKIIAQRERTEVLGRRRTTIFLAPPPTLAKSKIKSAQMNKSLNKSGIRITPKKSLKCHICSAVVEDAFSLAKHVLDHKFRREKQQDDLQNAAEN